MITQYNVLRRRLETEWVNVRAVAEKAQAAYADGGTYKVDASSLSLHSFYSGVERIFEWIARQIDGGLPEGSSWHRELLQQMTLDIPNVRPSVIQPSTAKLLDEFLGFRHVVRSLYSWELEPAKVERLLSMLPETVQATGTDLAAFGRFLGAAGHVDGDAGFHDIGDTDD